MFEKSKYLNRGGWLKLIEEVEKDFFDPDHWLGDQAFDRLYVELLSASGLSSEEREEIGEIIQRKIQDVPEIKKQAKEYWAKIDQEHDEAFARAQERYKAQSVFKRIGHYFNKTRPQDLNKDMLSAKSLDRLYIREEGQKDDR